MEPDGIPAETWVLLLVDGPPAGTALGPARVALQSEQLCRTRAFTEHLWPQFGAQLLALA